MEREGREGLVVREGREGWDVTVAICIKRCAYQS